MQEKEKNKSLTPNFDDVYRKCWEAVRDKNLSGWDLIEHVLKCAAELKSKKSDKSEG